MKPIVWVGSSRKDLKQFPDRVQDVVGRSLLDVQFGDRPGNARILHGFGSAAVLELVNDYDGDTFRAVYTVRFAGTVYVLHVFQKKSKRGDSTPKHDLEVIRQRLSEAERIHRGE